MDPIANMLVAVKNAYLAKKKGIIIPYSKFRFSVAKVLEKEKFVGKVDHSGLKIKIDLLYENQKPKISKIKKVSKLGLRVYIKSKNIKKIKGGKGIAIISTPQGMMTDHDAKRKKLGGEVICEVW